MNSKAKTIEEAAVGCAARLTEKDIDALRQHIGYTHHHFGYGMYLRNHYSYLIGSDELEEFVYDGDSLSPKIYNRILLLVFPEFRGYENIMERLTEFTMENLNAAYNIKYGKNYIVDVKPDNILTDTEYNFEWTDEERQDWFTRRDNEDKAYQKAIAEKLWEFDRFSETATSFGYKTSEINEVYETAIEMLDEHSIFMPLEVLFAKSPSSEALAAFRKAFPLIDLMVERMDRDEIGFLPGYLFSLREAVIELIKENGYLLEYTPDFQNDEEIVRLAVKDSPRAIEYANKRFKNDYKIAELAAKNSKYSLIFDIAEFKKYRDDDNIVKLALKANGANISGASKRIRSDYDFAVLALKNQRNIYPSSTFPSLSKELRKMKELALLELKAPCPSLDGFDKSLLKDKEIGEYIVSHHKLVWLIHYMSPMIQDMYFDRLPKRIRDTIECRRNS